MVNIIYDSRDGTAYSDETSASKDFINYIKALAERDKWHNKIISTSITITAIRVAIHEGVIPWDRIKFTYNDEVLVHDEHARFEYWPDGFADASLKLTGRLLTFKT
jgi:hypothetical protein